MEHSTQLDAAVPTAADAWTTVGSDTVPVGVTRIKKLMIGLAPDWGLTAGSVRMAPIIRLQGSGLQEQNPHEYVGKFGGHAEVTTGGISMQDLEVVYDVDIPVQSGGVVEVDCNTLDEAVTAGSVIVNIIYDDKAPVQTNSMSQYADAAVATAADAWAALGTITIPRADEGKDPKRIRGIVIAVALDQGTSAVSLRTVPMIRISGAGIKGSGKHEYFGKLHSQGEIGTTPSQGIVQDGGYKMHITDIEVNAGGQIVIEQQFVTEVPTGGTIAVGILYD